MVGEAIANYDPYIGVAIGMFVASLFAVMVYERASSRSRQQQPAAASSSSSKQRQDNDDEQ